MRCARLVIADATIVMPRRNSIFGGGKIIEKTSLYKKTIKGNYIDLINSGVALKPKHFVETPSRTVFNMFGVMTGEYKLANMQPFTGVFNLGDKTRLRVKDAKKMFKERVL